MIKILYIAVNVIMYRDAAAGSIEMPHQITIVCSVSCNGNADCSMSSTQWTSAMYPQFPSVPRTMDTLAHNASIGTY